MAPDPLLVLTFIGFFCQQSAETPATIPESWMGFYTIPAGGETYATYFAADNSGDILDSFTRPDIIQFGKVFNEMDKYYWKISFSPDTVSPIELPFKLGEPHLKRIGDIFIEYTFTLVNDTSVLQSDFRINYRTPKGAGQKLHKLEARFFDGTLHVCDVLRGAEKCETYMATLSPYLFGTYVSVFDPQSTNWSQVVPHHNLPLPKDVSWSSESLIWIGKLGNDYAFRYEVDPSYKLTFPLYLDRSDVRTRHEHETSNQVDTNPFYYISKDSNILVSAGFNSPFDGKAKFNQTGASIPGTTGAIFYKRVLPFIMDGLFENIPEFDENWAEFLYESQIDDFNQIIFSRGQTFYELVNSGLTPEKTFVIPFVLDTPSENQLPNGRVHKYMYTFQGRDEIRLRSMHIVADAEFTTESVFNITGIIVWYKVNNVTAKRFYRRVLPKQMLGLYESHEVTDDLIEFTKKIGMPQLAKNTTMELSETPDHVYHQVHVTEGAGTSAFSFVLGRAGEKMQYGKTLEYTYTYMEANHQTPVLRTSWSEQGGGPFKFDVVGVYNPQGYTATYVFGNNAYIARRHYNRLS